MEGRMEGGEEEEVDGQRKFFPRKIERINEVERLEGWPTTAARLAGWRRVTLQV